MDSSGSFRRQKIHTVKIPMVYQVRSGRGAPAAPDCPDQSADNGYRENQERRYPQPLLCWTDDQLPGQRSLTDSRSVPDHESGSGVQSHLFCIALHAMAYFLYN